MKKRQGYAYLVKRPYLYTDPIVANKESGACPMNVSKWEIFY